MTSGETSNKDKGQSTVHPSSSAATKRQERLEAELRANLQRRKEQSRNRKAKPAAGDGGGGAD